MNATWTGLPFPGPLFFFSLWAQNVDSSLAFYSFSNTGFSSWVAPLSTRDILTWYVQGYRCYFKCFLKIILVWQDSESRNTFCYAFSYLLFTYFFKKNQWFSFCLRVTFMPFFIASRHKNMFKRDLLPQWPLSKYFPSVDTSAISVWNRLLSRGTQMNLCTTYHNVCILGEKKTFKHSYLPKPHVPRTRIVLRER